MTIPTERLRDMEANWRRDRPTWGETRAGEIADALTELLAARETIDLHAKTIASNAIVLDAINATLAEAGYDLPLQEQVGACIADVKALTKERDALLTIAKRAVDARNAIRDFPDQREWIEPMLALATEHDAAMLELQGAIERTRAALAATEGEQGGKR